MDVSISDLDNFKVKQLKDFLRSRGEQVTGSKGELIDRAKGVLLLKKQPLSDIKHRDENFDNQRLVEKLVSPLGEKLPDPASIKYWNKDVSVIPSVNDNELYNFLVLNNNRTYDSRQSGAKRQLKAKVFYEDRHVHSISFNAIDDNCSHCFVKCLVIPSLPSDTAPKKPDYQVWVCLSKVTGRIHSASCTCTAGKGETCNHVAALLYALVDITTKKADGTISSTSTLCKWNQPRKRKLSPKKSQDLSFTKHNFKTTPKSNTGANKVESTTTVKPVNVQNFKSKLASVNPNAAWLKLFKPATVPIKTKLPILHNINLQVRDSVNLDSEKWQNTFSEYFDSLHVSAEECSAIELLSRGQSKNPLWTEARHGRITSSAIGSVCKKGTTTAPDNLVKSLLYASSFDTEALRWGRNHEAAARRQYINRMQKTHPDLIVRQSGLVVNTSYPHLGASPDGFVNCECKECSEPQGLLEIKCPFKYRTLTPEDAAKEKDFCCQLVNGAVTLKTDHIYFYQLQAQMAICLRPWCDFVIWTCKGMTVQRIEYDYLFWENSMLPLINKFYVKGVIPELFSSRVKRCKPLFT